MTSPTTTIGNAPRLAWQEEDARKTDLYNRQRLQDRIVPAAQQLTPQDDYTSRLQAIQNNSAEYTANSIAVYNAQKQRDDALAAAELQRQRDAAMQQAYSAFDQWSRGQQTQNYSGGSAQNYSGGGSSSSTNLWGQGGQQGVANVLRAAGFPESAIPTMIGIAGAESRFNPNAFNPKNANGTTDAGLFQINSSHAGNPWYPQNLYDPLQSARAAYALYQGRGGQFTDWTVYNSGQYRNFMPRQAPPIQPANIAPYAANTGSAGGLRMAVVQAAQKYIGVPYVWGGESLAEGGLDCSGLVYAVYNQMGIGPIPRLTAQGYSTSYFSNGVRGYRTSVANLQPGDLVAWNGGYDRGVQVGHIAIYAGNGEIIEAYGQGVPVRRSRLYNLDNAFGVHLYLPGDR